MSLLCIWPAWLYWWVVSFFCYMYNEGNFCVSKLEDQVLWPGEKEGKSEWEQVQLLAAAVGKQGELCSPLQKLGDPGVGGKGQGLYHNLPTLCKVLLEMLRVLWKSVGRTTEMYEGMYKIVIETVFIRIFLLSRTSYFFLLTLTCF